MLAADNWCVKVDDKIYGPYSSQQMRKLAHEGRLASWSLISPAGSRAWREAQKETAFSQFFGFDEAAPRKAANQRTFGKRDDTQNAEPETADAKANAAKRRNTPVEPSIANFVIIFDVVSASASRVEAAIMSLGAGFRIADNVWNVACELTAVGVRNAIAPYLNPRESIFVVDTTRGRTSWQNYAPELQAKITAAYTATRQAS